MPDLAAYEVHLCPEGCCVRFGQLAGSPCEHLAACDGCALCKCEQCGAARYTVVDGRTVAMLMCYLLHDVFKQFFLDAEWYAEVAPARAQQSADWCRTPEGKRCTAALVAIGYDLAEVRITTLCDDDAAHMCPDPLHQERRSLSVAAVACRMHAPCLLPVASSCVRRRSLMLRRCGAGEWACDGGEMRKFMMHSMQVFLVRYKEAAARFACRKRNVAPIMIVLGPKEPKKRQWRTLWWLLFDCTGAAMAALLTESVVRACLCCSALTQSAAVHTLNVLLFARAASTQILQAAAIGGGIAAEVVGHPSCRVSDFTSARAVHSGHLHVAQAD